MQNKSKDALKEQETNTKIELTENTEIELTESKFYLLEDKTDEKKIERWIIGDVKKSVKRLKELLNEKDIDKLSLISIDISGKEWKIAPASWGIVASAIAKGDGTVADDAAK